VIKRIIASWLLVVASLQAQLALAVDSYRYTHVTIETPWLIFIFLLVIVLLPFILSAILYWYFATRKQDDAEKSE
jgi:hypothetical protein